MSDAATAETAVHPPSPGFLAGVAGRLSAESRVVEGEPLARKTTLGVGGRARFYAEPATREDLCLLLRQAEKCGIRVYLLGRGSNVIVPDEGVDGLVLRLQHAGWRGIEAGEDGRIWAGAGVRLRKLCGEACRQGLGGLEFLEGIPGTVGGALRMNAGAMGGWFFDLVEEVHLMTLGGEEKKCPKETLRYDYRICHDLMDTIAMGVYVRAPSRETASAIKRRLAAYQEKRAESQPRESSAGCIFKNPEGGHAGKIIDELGLKGKRVGAAEVSAVHGNFLINRGGARAADVIELVRALQEEIRRRRGIELHPEVLLFGRDWRDVL